ncbi:MAG: hypothetical protein ACJAUT_000230 [Cellvibrionaceae bacterium]
MCVYVFLDAKFSNELNEATHTVDYKIMTFITGISNDPSRMHNGDDRRRTERKSSFIRVEITHPSIGTIIGSTRDISDGGASVKIENHPIPPLGTSVKVRFIKLSGAINKEPVDMNVMHHMRNTIGLMFA